MPTKDSTVKIYPRYWAYDQENSIVAYRTKQMFGTTKTLTRIRNGASNPRWREQIRAGENATTSLTGTFTSCDDSPVFFHYERFNTGLGAWITAEVSGYANTAVTMTVPIYTGGWTSRANARATAKFYASVRELSQSISGPTFLGELRETIRMLRKPAGALQDHVKRYMADLKKINQSNKSRYFHKDRPRYTQNLTKTVGGLWLERAFGWLPLINDIEDAQKAMNDALERDRSVKVNAGSRDSKDKGTTVAYQVYLPGSHLGFTEYRRVTEEDVVRFRGKVRAKADTTIQDRFARWGFHPSEFIPTAWELLPWSFLADYFANIGDIINCHATDMSGLSWVSKSTVQTVEKHHICVPTLDSALLNDKANGRLRNVRMTSGTHRTRVRQVTRQATSNMTPPDLYFTMPRSPMQMLNITALLSQASSDIHPQMPSKRNFRL